MAGDKKRKGTSGKKKCMLYKLEARLDQNRTRKAKAQKTLFLKRLRKLGKTLAGGAIVKATTDKLLSQFESCKDCRDKVFTATIAPVIHLDDGRVFGGYCVRCGHVDKSACRV